VHRKYFELCVLTQVARELGSADIIVDDSEEYSDFNTQLISWEEYEEQMPPYCEMLGLSTTTSGIIEELKKKLSNTASQLDQSYPDNEWLSITSQGLTLHRHDKSSKPDDLEKVDELIKRQLETKSILDILVESEGWLNLHKKFTQYRVLKAKLLTPENDLLPVYFAMAVILAQARQHNPSRGLAVNKLPGSTFIMSLKSVWTRPLLM
jgi:hypothetical protein